MPWRYYVSYFYQISSEENSHSLISQNLTRLIVLTEATFKLMDWNYFNISIYLVFIPGGNTENRVYTIGIDREEVFLFCNSSNSSISLTDIKWRVTGNNGTFPNPLIPHSNMLLQSGTSYNIQCVDIRTNFIILSTQYTVQGIFFVLVQLLVYI